MFSIISMLILFLFLTGVMLLYTHKYTLTPLTVVSLILSLATIGLWIDSIWYHTQYATLGINEYSRFEFENSKDGGIRIEYLKSPLSLRSTLRTSRDHISDFINPPERRWFHTDFKFGPYRYNMQGPHWFFLIQFAFVPAVWLATFGVRKRHRLGRMGRCISCGYDLTGNETGQCPECGAKSEAQLS